MYSRPTQKPRHFPLRRTCHPLLQDLRQRRRRGMRQVRYTQIMLQYTTVLLSNPEVWLFNNVNKAPWTNSSISGRTQKASACSRITRNLSGFANIALSPARHLKTHLAGITISLAVALLIGTVMDRVLIRQAATRRRRTKGGVAKGRRETHGCPGCLVDMRLNPSSVVRSSTSLIAFERVRWRALGIRFTKVKALPQLVDEARPLAVFTDGPIEADRGNIPITAPIIRTQNSADMKDLDYVLGLAPVLHLEVSDRLS